ncbi:MAG TPA: hypothetical protein HPP77_04265 [Candidatus Hydrogenedentes bacterium]|nr:hypothetical protein [Candidatus Hydrogenedentota bacterium]HIJ73242.1 hypothetical protein [Candidatus Hydrogenedentota bacterium]
MRYYTDSGISQIKAYVGAPVTNTCPSVVWLDLTSDCNLYCVTCRGRPTARGRTMDGDLFRKVVDQTCHGVLLYALHGLGESLLLMDFSERLEYVSRRKLPRAKLDLYTNGMLLSAQTAQLLLDHGVNVTVSFDGACAETFERIRQGAEFGRVCRNLEKSSNLPDANSGPSSPGVHIAIQRDNWEELSEIVKLTHSLGAGRISFDIVAGPDTTLCPPFDGSAADAIAEAINLAEHLGMFVDGYPTRFGDMVWLDDTYAPANRFAISTLCDAPYFSAFICWNGDVMPCCVGPVVLGNVNERDFAEIWGGEAYENIRKDANDPERMPDICRQCPLANRFLGHSSAMGSHRG